MVSISLEKLKVSGFTFTGRVPGCELTSRATTLLMEHVPGDKLFSSITKIPHGTEVFGG